jgi:hypothetical protein
MFNTTYKKILENLTRENRREMKRLADSILKKGLRSPKLIKKEKELLEKMSNWINRSYFDFDYTLEELLFDCSNSLTDRQAQKSSQQFVVNATRQSASEKAQMEHMKNRGFEINKLKASGEDSLRFDEQSYKLVPVKIEGVTSRSLDYKREYNGIIEYFTGKVTFGEGGGQNGMKTEIVDFLKRAVKFLEQNLDCNFVFTALVDGDALTDEEREEYKKYTSNKVRLMNCDTYEPYSN